MNNLLIALKNLKNNFSFYALYFLSVSFVITIFFAFTSFSMNAVMLKKYQMTDGPSIIGFFAIIAGYCLALDILRGRKSVWLTVGLYPVGMLTLTLILFGTVLFIASFLPFAVQTGKRDTLTISSVMALSLYYPIAAISHISPVGN